MLFVCEKLYVRYNRKKDLQNKLRKQYSVALYNVYITNQILKLSKQVLERKIVSEFYFADYESHDIEMIICVDDFINEIRENRDEDEEMTLQIYSIFKDNLQKLLIFKKLVDELIYEWKREANSGYSNEINHYYQEINSLAGKMSVNVIQILNHFTITLNKRFGVKVDPYKKQYCNEVYKVYKEQLNNKK